MILRIKALAVSQTQAMLGPQRPVNDDVVVEDAADVVVDAVACAAATVDEALAAAETGDQRGVGVDVVVCQQMTRSVGGTRIWSLVCVAISSYG